MASGRPIEDELLAAALTLQPSPAALWDARDLLDAVELAMHGDVKIFTVQRNLRRFVVKGWVVEHSAEPDGPGRPRKLYQLRPEGVHQAQYAAGRLLGGGARWALEPLRISLTLDPPAP